MNTLVTLGGPGSGHHGHAGRPGQKGGSAPARAPWKDPGGDLTTEQRQQWINSLFPPSPERERQQLLADAQPHPLAHVPAVVGLFELRQEDAQRYVAAYGQAFKAQVRPEDIEHGAPNECYKNASLLVIEREDLTYVEGFATKNNAPLAMVHAWATDASGNVVDNTLPDPENWTYFGVKYDRAKYLQYLYKAKIYGVLGSTTKNAMKAIETGGNGLR